MIVIVVGTELAELAGKIDTKFRRTEWGFGLLLLSSDCDTAVSCIGDR